jgi:hypothetical protein
MKKRISFLFTATTVLFLFSCKKDIEVGSSPSLQISEQASANQPSALRGIQPPVKLDSLLVGRYTFDNTLKEATGKLANAVPTSATAVTYVTDRKGMTGKALKLTGTYGLRIMDVMKGHKFSVSAWAKYGDAKSYMAHFINPEKGFGPALYNAADKFSGSISTPTTTGVPSGPLDNNWHHLVATYDGYYLRFYVDGQYVGFSWNITGPFGPYKDNYLLGFIKWNTYSLGFIDDVRLYSRTLNAAEAQALYQIY